MAGFDLKTWLDAHVVPLLPGPPPLRLYSFIWNAADGAQHPEDILVWLHAGNNTEPTEPTQALELDEEGKPLTRPAEVCPDDFDPSAWPLALRRLLEQDGFRFDYLREQLAVALEGGVIKIFGGDGTPLCNEQGMASCRLFKKMPDGINLILQVGSQYPSGPEAIAAVKEFFAQFDDNPLTLAHRFRATFGEA